ncbi:hypothetical protein GCK72_013242 [Caenorhabditis remanei]|uniref:DUF38 domain-containing protein n=1 Tax=Caenorhabditis remanei TaxID=31234 RepID=A0A6A5GN30_CAERE|nr:hypothetical protein GCK72_013242 [Caenorhabditis remanei]KAF1756788.1 hypothetical protein GCK72_013242 [Caenorhabditis remanei]
MLRVSKEDGDEILKRCFNNRLDGQSALNALRKKYPEAAEEQDKLENLASDQTLSSSSSGETSEKSSLKRQVSDDSSETSGSKKSREDTPEDQVLSGGDSSQEGPSVSNPEAREITPDSEEELLNDFEDETFFDDEIRKMKESSKHYTEEEIWKNSRRGVFLRFEEWALEEIKAQKDTILIPRLMYLRKLSPYCRELVENIKLSIEKIKLTIGRNTACIETHINGDKKEIKYRGTPESGGTGFSRNDIFRAYGAHPNFRAVVVWDLIALIRMSSFKLDELEITMGQVFKEDEPSYSDDKFYHCLRKHLKQLSREVEVEKFSFTISLREQEGYLLDNPRLCSVSSVMKYLKPKTLKYLKFRIWRVQFPLQPPSGTKFRCIQLNEPKPNEPTRPTDIYFEQSHYEFPSTITKLKSWKAAAELDIEDDKIVGTVIANTHFERISFGLISDPEIAVDIIKTIAAHPPTVEMCVVTFTTPIDSKTLREAIKYSCPDVCSEDNNDILIQPKDKEKRKVRLCFTVNGFILTLDGIPQ